MHDSTRIRIRPIGSVQPRIEGKGAPNPSALAFKAAPARRVASAARLVLALGILALLWPASLGGDVSYVLVSGSSMEPGLHTGDLVVVREQATYEPGDVVAFRVPEGEVGAGAQVIHRIVGGDGTTGYRVQGDNKEGADPWLPTDDDVVGKRWGLAPGLGRILAELRTPLVLGLLAGVGVFAAIATSKPKAARPRSGSHRPVRS